MSTEFDSGKLFNLIGIIDLEASILITILIRTIQTDSQPISAYLFQKTGSPFYVSHK